VGKRYGRNQKRAARTKIFELEASLKEANNRNSKQEMRLRELENLVSNSESRTFDRFVKSSGLLDSFIQQIAYSIGQNLEKEIAPIARQIFNSRKEQPRIDMRCHPDDGIRILRGYLPPLQYNYVMTNLDMEQFMETGN
jgi:hypothetical protein